MLRNGVGFSLISLQIRGVHFVQPSLDDIHRGLHFFQAGLHLLLVGLRLFYTGLRRFLAGCRLFSLGIHTHFHPFLMGVHLGYYIFLNDPRLGLVDIHPGDESTSKDMKYIVIGIYPGFHFSWLVFISIRKECIQIQYC
jgi:hypothetical protein